MPRGKPKSANPKYRRPGCPKLIVAYPEDMSGVMAAILAARAIKLHRAQPGVGRFQIGLANGKSVYVTVRRKGYPGAPDSFVIERVVENFPAL
jgi:hypothetical protein